ncbi:hypothetical protein MTO96_022230 [Rhipicephalus appendiculatus]
MAQRSATLEPEIPLSPSQDERWRPLLAKEREKKGNRYGCCHPESVARGNRRPQSPGIQHGFQTTFFAVSDGHLPLGFADGVIWQAEMSELQLRTHKPLEYASTVWP